MGELNFRVIERTQETLNNEYEEFKDQYLHNLGINTAKICENMGISRNAGQTLKVKVAEETGYERKWTGKRTILIPVSENRHNWSIVDYEKIYNEFQEDYLYNGLSAKESQRKYNLNTSQYARLQHMVFDRTGWKRKNGHMMINVDTGEERRINGYKIY